MDEKELIKQRIDLIQLISETVTLTKAGSHYKARCPFHSEKTPSFMVNPELGIYKCFGCGKGGDCFNWVMDTEGVPFIEALQILAKRAGVTLTTHQSDQSTRDRQQILEALSQAGEFYHWLLTKHPHGQPALQYLYQRGITDQAIQAFKLGFAPFEWDGLLLTLTKQSYSLPVLIKANLVQPSTSKAGGYDRFRGRIIFPLNDPRGQTIGFAGRLLPQELSPSNIQTKETAKYINTAETDVFHKRQLLYGLDITKTAIRQAGRVVIVEGELDAIASWQAQVPEVVAIKGSALTEEQVNILKRYTDTVILALDMDLAGDQAARRGIQVAEAAGLEVRLVRMVGGKDPADLIQTDPLAWKQLLTQSLDIYEFLLASALDRHGTATATAKRKIVAELIPIWRGISSRVVQAHWIAELARRLTLPESVIWQEIGVATKPSPSSRNSAPVSPTAQIPDRQTRRQQLEELLIGRLLLTHPQQLITDQVRELLTLPWSPRLLTVVEETTQDTATDLKLENLTLPPELQSLAAQAMMLADRHDDPKVSTPRLLGELTELHLKHQRHLLLQQLSDAEQSSQEDAIASLQKQINSLNLRLAQLGSKKV